MKKAVSNILKALVLVILLFVSNVSAGDEAAKILADIEEYIRAEGYGPYGPTELGKSIVEQIELAPEVISDVLIEKIHVAGISDEALSVYIWGDWLYERCKYC